MAGAIYGYTFSSGTAAPPAHKGLRLDAADLALATRAWFDDQTLDNVDIREALLRLPTGATLVIQAAGDHAQQASYTVAALPVAALGYVEIPLTFVSQSAPLITFVEAGPVDVLFYGTVAAAGLLTLAYAKQQLRITDTLHDADVQAKLDAAEGVILEYLGECADPAWTPETLPKSVETAILRYLSHLYEDRTGRASDGETPAAAEAWANVRQLLTPLRRQAIGVGAEAAP